MRDKASAPAIAFEGFAVGTSTIVPPAIGR